MRVLIAGLLLLLICPVAVRAQQAVPPVAGRAAAGNAQRDAIARTLADDSDMYQRYVYNDSQTVDKQVALHLPVMPDEDIQRLLTDYVSQILSVTPSLYPNHMARVAGFFVKSGWAQYQQQWQQAQIASLVVDNQYSITAMVLNPARIVAKGRERTGANPAYRWITEVPVLLTYTKPDTPSQTFNIVLRVGVTRVPMRADGSLIAIDQWGTVAPEPAANTPAR